MGILPTWDLFQEQSIETRIVLPGDDVGIASSAVSLDALLGEEPGELAGETSRAGDTPGFAVPAWLGRLDFLEEIRVKYQGVERTMYLLVLDDSPERRQLLDGDVLPQRILDYGPELKDLILLRVQAGRLDVDADVLQALGPRFQLRQQP